MVRTRLHTFFTASIFIVVGVFCLNSCANIEEESPLTSGIIEYNITYPFPPEDQYLARILPSTMTLTYSPEYSKSEVTLSMGMIKMYYQANNTTKELTEYVKFMTNKFANTLTPEEFNTFKKQYPKYKIEFTQETKVIAGYNCKQAVVTLTEQDNYQFKLYYTDELSMKDFNWWTPFSEINGVLMEYEIERYNILMHLTVSKIEPAVHTPETFTIPSEYKVVPRSEMENMHEMFEELNQ